MGRRWPGGREGWEHKIILHLISALVGRVVAGRGGTLGQPHKTDWTTGDVLPPPPPPPPPPLGLSSHNTTISTFSGPSSHPRQPSMDCVVVILLLLLLLVEDGGAERGCLR